MGNWRHFLELVEIINEIEENFSLKKDHDVVIQFWSFTTIITELKKINFSQGKQFHHQ